MDRRTGWLGGVVDAQCATSFLRRGGQHTHDQQLSCEADGRNTAKLATPEQCHPHLLGQAACPRAPAPATLHHGTCALAAASAEPARTIFWAFSPASIDSGGRRPPSHRIRRDLSSSAATSLRSCDRSPAV